MGSAGLGPTIAALGEGIDLALANKESLVVGGELVTALAEATGARIIPVDSEHSALFQLIALRERRARSTAWCSPPRGGPFRGRSTAELAGVTVEEALAHPTWEMGGKITIDSATLMNKGLELIEAQHLFGIDYERIDVVVHPQSIIHALVQLNDGASLAHMGYPDMRVPISYALHYPERADVPVRPLDLAELGQLDLRAARRGRVPVPAPGARGGRRRRHRSLRAERGQRGGGGGLPRRRARRSLGIAEVIERALDELPAEPVRHFSDLYRADAAARARARELVEEGVRRVSWVLVVARLHGADHAPRARPLHGREGRGHARGALLAVLPAAAREEEDRRDRVRDRRDPARRLREDQRDEPGGGPPGRGRTRAYYSQPVWKRVVVIAAGPFVNLVIGFVVLFVFYGMVGAPAQTATRSARSTEGFPAQSVLRAGDELVSVDGKRGEASQLSQGRSAAAPLRRQQPPTAGCRATRPRSSVVKRDGKLITRTISREYDAAVQAACWWASPTRSTHNGLPARQGDAARAPTTSGASRSRRVEPAGADLQLASSASRSAAWWG